MMEAFNLKGTWWLPGQDDKFVAGTLSFSPQTGTRLELMGGSLGPLPESHHPIICGALDGIGFVTLWDCLFMEGRTNSAGYSGSTWIVRMVFQRTLFDSEDQLIFEKMTLRFTDLELWLDTSDIPDDLNLTGRAFGERPEQIDDAVIELETAKVVFCHYIQPGGSMTHKAHVERVAQIQIKVAEPLQIETFITEYVVPLRNFLTFAVGHSVALTSMWAVSPIGQTEEQSTKENWSQVFYSTTERGKARESETTRYSMFFLQSMVKDELPLIIKRWFLLQRKLGPVLALYFGLEYSPSGNYLDWEFVILAQVIEALHRRLYGGSFMKTSEFQVAFEELQTVIKHLNITSDHRESLISRVKFGYEYSLRKRLTMLLLDTLKPHSTLVHRIVRNYKGFVKDFVDTRNYLTHYSEEEPPEMVEDTDALHRLVQKSQLLVRLCICHELQLAPDLVAELFLRQNRYKYWLD